MRKKAKKLAALGLTATLLFMALSMNVYAAAFPVVPETAVETAVLEENEITASEAMMESVGEEEANLYDAVGTGKTVSSEGSYNYQYWKLQLYGSGSMCWVTLNYGDTANQITTKLVVERSTGLWQHYDYYTLQDSKRSAPTCSSRWDDGVSFVALSATGSGTINGTTVDQLSVSGW